MLRKETLEYIDKFGVKKSFIAKTIGVSPSNFSQWLHGKLGFSVQTETRLREFLHNKSE